MKIREERIEKVEVKKIYVAFDGTEFMDAEQCGDYELTATCAINKMFRSVPSKEYIFYDTGLDMFCGEDCIHFVRIRSVEDLEAINKWLINTFTTYKEDTPTLGVDAIGTIQIITEYDGGYYLMGTPDDLKANYCRKIDKMFKELIDDDKEGEDA